MELHTVIYTTHPTHRSIITHRQAHAQRAQVLIASQKLLYSLCLTHAPLQAILYSTVCASSVNEALALCNKDTNPNNERAGRGSHD